MVETQLQRLPGLDKWFVDRPDLIHHPGYLIFRESPLPATTVWEIASRDGADWHHEVALCLWDLGLPCERNITSTPKGCDKKTTLFLSLLPLI